MMTEEQIGYLNEKLNHVLAELSQTQEELRATKEELQVTQEKLHVAQERIEELEKQKTPPPAFVKATVKKPEEGERKARKKRDAQFNRGRHTMQATQSMEHRLITCPDCHLRLGGISLARSREVIDLPPPASVEVMEHRIYKGWCSNCQRWHEAPVDLHDQVLGQGRIGHRLASLIATLRTVMRLPFRQIQLYLATLHHVHLSVGDLVEIHQRCWVHFLRDAHELKDKHPHDEALLAWAASVKAIYERAVKWAESGPDPGPSPPQQQQRRQEQQQTSEQELSLVCQPYLRNAAPQHTLCERVERFLPELFVLVRVPGVPAHNHLAERSVRPLVIARKVSGGTRSPKG